VTRPAGSGRFSSDPGGLTGGTRRARIVSVRAGSWAGCGSVAVSTVHVVVPDGIDDPARPSGGNRYDRRICDGLAALGWDVRELVVPGPWPRWNPAALSGLARTVAALPDDALVVLDALIASSAPAVLLPESRRLRLVVLVHMPLGDGPSGAEDADARTREAQVLSSATAVVTTSAWTRRRLLDRYPLSEERVHVAEPGVDPADLAPGTAEGGELLCVAAVTPHKGHDALLSALAELKHLPWRCTCVGSLSREPGFVDRLRRQADETGISDRVRFAGPLTGAALDGAYAAADVLVLASRGETYGMVVTEALAHGLPVVATAVGGLPSTLGEGPRRGAPGLLVPPDDPAALSRALCAWLGDAGLRRTLRQAAGERRATLSGWSRTAEQIARILAEVA
jgi:glycosyltransferase involved in cell wall biosynthesis